MVRIALAGASGNVAQEVLGVLVDSQKHQILLPSRKRPGHIDQLPTSVTWTQTDYRNPQKLAELLTGIHTLLCFITPQSDPGNTALKNLIDAAIEAGVQRYAPSEWASSTFEHMPWYAGKEEIRRYLEDLNKEKKVIEYCLFQPGMFVNYFVSPHKTTQHLHPFQNMFDFNNRQAIMLEGSDDAQLSLITVADFCMVVALAVEDEDEWPVVGGLRGQNVTVGQLISLGEKIPGPFEKERVKAEDLEAGTVKSSWLPLADHPAIPPEQVKKLSAEMVAGMLLAISKGAMDVSDEWNRRLPDYSFTTVEGFLTEAWQKIMDSS